MTLAETQLEKLVEKLKGKSVYTNLKAISLGECKDKVQEVTGISSLLTHAIIEMRTDKTYKILVANLYERLGTLLYNLE